MSLGPASGSHQDAAHVVPQSFAVPGWHPPAHWAPPAPPPPPRRRGPHPLLFFGVLTLAVALTVWWLQSLAPLTLDPAPSASATATRRPAPSGSAGPTTTASPSTTAEQRLMRSPLYRVAMTGSCQRISSPRTREAYEKQVTELLDCLGRLFQPLIDRAGGDYEQVRHRHYGKQVDTPCGADRDAYAFYCEGDRTIYFSEEVYADAEFARLAVADVVLHEYGHHVQSMMGFFDAAEELDESREVTTRREELQVFCWTYYLFAAMPSFELTDGDRSFFLELWGNTNDAEGHGSVKAQQYWGPRGLDGADLGACNTWTVPKETVR